MSRLNPELGGVKIMFILSCYLKLDRCRPLVALEEVDPTAVCTTDVISMRCTCTWLTWIWASSNAFCVCSCNVFVSWYCFRTRSSSCVETDDEAPYTDSEWRSEVWGKGKHEIWVSGESEITVQLETLLDSLEFSLFGIYIHSSNPIFIREGRNPVKNWQVEFLPVVQKYSKVFPTAKPRPWNHLLQSLRFETITHE